MPSKAAVLNFNFHYCGFEFATLNVFYYWWYLWHGLGHSLKTLRLEFE